ncbi:MAG: Glycerate dehydrogenase [Alphaproteobacteria bacterium MarineAlpha9_Bin4]|nr:hypothetical protein [Pelagibacterales bacterium]PPR27652.1 MAG: Glycerate dehydrogenase [Alphaproteobacteria bacterium MarineAlpha9_Bin4]|tara:strand:- start:431 stop:1441 length:1011 start_codon:yes stop_codon:yes gene_type:complete
MKSKLKIVVQGTKLISDYLKQNINIPNSVFYSKIQNSEYFKKVYAADVLVTMSWGKSMFGGKSIMKTPSVNKLKLLHTPGAGIDGINFKLLPSNCKVCNVYEHETPIAEYCLANMLNWETKLVEKINRFKKLDWSDSLFSLGEPHSELSGKCIGIIGYGRIGKEIANLLNSFKTKIYAFTRVVRKKDSLVKKSIVISDLNKYINELDYIILCCPLNKSTQNLINEDNLKLMKKNSVIINIARGDIINEKDFYEALKNNIIGGGIIDTWYRYPLNKNKLKFKPSKYNFHTLKNVIMTPHISAWSKAMIIRRSKIIKKNIENLYYGKRLLNRIDISNF